MCLVFNDLSRNVLGINKSELYDSAYFLVGGCLSIYGVNCLVTLHCTVSGKKMVLRRL